MPTEGILLILSALTDTQCAIILSHSAIYTVPESLVHAYCERIVTAHVKIDKESLVMFVRNEL